MGAYLSAPVTKKFSEDDGNDSVKFGVSGMQGWRISMEDAHICQPALDDDVSLFAVFDGHGGSEVAEYCATHFGDFIKSSQSYKDGNIKQSLIDAFLGIDQHLTKEEVIMELKELADEGQDEDEGVKEAELLAQEANMPIEDLLKRIKEGRGLQDGEEDEEELDDDDEDSGEDESGENESGEDEEEGEEEEEAKEEESSDGEGPKITKQSKASSDNPGTPESGQCSKKDATKKEVQKNGNVKPSEEKKVEKSNPDKELEDGEDETDEEEDVGDEEDEEDEIDEEDDFEKNDDFVLPNSDDEVGKDSGTTAIIALLHKDHLYVANAGDSRAVLCRGGEAIDMSEDHKPEDTIERERIEAAGGKISADGRVNGGLNLSRAIGDHFYKMNTELPPEKQVISAMPDVKDIRINDEDNFLILACDGIWNVLSSQEAVDFVSTKLKEQEGKGEISLSGICEDLFDKCLASDTSGDGSGCDNMTCVLVLFGHNKSQFPLVIKRKREKSPVYEEKQEGPRKKKRKTS